MSHVQTFGNVSSTTKTASPPQNILVLLFFVWCLFATVCDGSWVANIDGALQFDFRASTTDDAGNIYVALSYNATSTVSISFDSGQTTISLPPTRQLDSVILKLHPSGSLIWTARITGDDSDLITSLDVGADGTLAFNANAYSSNSLLILPSGSTYSKFRRNGKHTVVLSEAGVFQWATDFTGAGWQTTLVSLNPPTDSILTVSRFAASHTTLTISHKSNNVDRNLVTVSVPQPALLLSAHTDLMLMKQTIDGDLLWLLLFAGPSSVILTSIDSDQVGDDYVVIRTNPNPTFTIYNVTSASDLQPVMSFEGNNATGSVFVMKLSKYGHVVWINEMGTNGDENMVSTKHGSVVTAGQWTGTNSFRFRPISTNNVSTEMASISEIRYGYTMKQSLNGTLEWILKMNSPATDTIESLSSGDVEKNIYVSGMFSNPLSIDNVLQNTTLSVLTSSSGFLSSYLLKFSSSASLISSLIFAGEDGPVQMLDHATDPKGNIFAAFLASNTSVSIISNNVSRSTLTKKPNDNLYFLYNQSSSLYIGSSPTSSYPLHCRFQSSGGVVELLGTSTAPTMPPVVIPDTLKNETTEIFCDRVRCFVSVGFRELSRSTVKLSGVFNFFYTPSLNTLLNSSEQVLQQDLVNACSRIDDPLFLLGTAGNAVLSTGGWEFELSAQFGFRSYQDIASVTNQSSVLVRFGLIDGEDFVIGFVGQNTTFELKLGVFPQNVVKVETWTNYSVTSNVSISSSHSSPFFALTLIEGQLDVYRNASLMWSLNDTRIQSIDGGLYVTTWSSHAKITHFNVISAPLSLNASHLLPPPDEPIDTSTITESQPGGETATVSSTETHFSPPPNSLQPPTLFSIPMFYAIILLASIAFVLCLIIVLVVFMILKMRRRRLDKYNNSTTHGNVTRMDPYNNVPTLVNTVI